MICATHCQGTCDSAISDHSCHCPPTLVDGDIGFWTSSTFSSFHTCRQTKYTKDLVKLCKNEWLHEQGFCETKSSFLSSDFLLLLQFWFCLFQPQLDPDDRSDHSSDFFGHSSFGDHSDFCHRGRQGLSWLSVLGDSSRVSFEPGFSHWFSSSKSSSAIAGCCQGCTNLEEADPRCLSHHILRCPFYKNTHLYEYIIIYIDHIWSYKTS